jgi:antitoxin (DNA-binding transcriptional repressor) of toxin-antitoxin stability system
MIHVTTAEAHADLPKYLAEVAAGNIVVVMDHDRPVAEIRPVPQPASQARPIGWLKGKWSLPDSFFDPLPDDVLRSFEGREEAE